MKRAHKAGLATLISLSAAVDGDAAGRPAPDDMPLTLIELRQYTLHDGQRDTLVRLFERELVHTQEAVGMAVAGIFIDLDRPNRFVWIRAFPDMETRRKGLTAFYGGRVWQAHRDAANATMIDSDNVLLLRPPPSRRRFTLHARGRSEAGLIVATIYYLNSPPPDALRVFENKVMPALDRTAAAPLAWFVPQTAPNTYPALPVRQGEQLIVWFARYASVADWQSHAEAVRQAERPLRTLLARAPEVLRLAPTSKSRLR